MVAVVALEIGLGNISWQLMLVAVWDLIFAVLFFRALKPGEDRSSRAAIYWPVPKEGESKIPATEYKKAL